MRERYRTLEAMLALGEFSIAELVARSDVSESTIRTILRRESLYVEPIATESTGRHGPRPGRWRVRAKTREHLSETLRQLENSGAGPWPGEPQEAAQALPAARVASNTTAAGRDTSITAPSDVAVEVIHEKVVPPGPTGQGSLAPSIASKYPGRELSGRKAKLFISYSHRDDRYREQLVTHLAGLRRQGVIADWHDRKIVPGQEWRDAIDQNLDAADCVLLLVSPDFLASDYCYSVEMQRTLEKHREGRVLVIPVIVRPADWQHTPLADLQALPKDAKPVVEWPRRDRAWLSVTEGLRRALAPLQRVLATADNRRELSVEADLEPRLEAEPDVPAEADRNARKADGRKAQEAELRLDTVQNLLDLDWYEFEDLMVQLFEAIPEFDQVRRTRSRADGGINLVAVNTTPFVGGRVAIQAKRYAPHRKVDIAAVREVVGFISHREFNKGIIITTSDFTSAAREEATRFGVELYEGERLLWLLRQHLHREYNVVDDERRRAPIKSRPHE